MSTLLNYRIYQHEMQYSDPIPVIMLHGLLGSLDNWNFQAKKLLPQRRVISIDLRNHGHSPHVKGMSYREMIADIIALLDDLNITQCDLMGHSMGGKVAMTLALHYPQRLRSLIVVDIAPKAYSPKHQAILYAMLSLPLKTIKQRKQAEQWLSSAVSSSVERGFLLKNLKRNTTGFYWQCCLAEIAKNYLKISSFHLNKQQRYTAPTLFIKGGQSDYIQTQDYALIQQYFPNAEIQCLEQAGHLPHVEDSQGFYRLLSKFLP